MTSSEISSISILESERELLAAQFSAAERIDLNRGSIGDFDFARERMATRDFIRQVFALRQGNVPSTMEQEALRKAAIANGANASVATLLRFETPMTVPSFAAETALMSRFIDRSEMVDTTGLISASRGTDPFEKTRDGIFKRNEAKAEKLKSALVADAEDRADRAFKDSPEWKAVEALEAEIARRRDAGAGIPNPVYLDTLKAAARRAGIPQHIIDLLEFEQIPTVEAMRRMREMQS